MIDEQQLAAELAEWQDKGAKKAPLKRIAKGYGDAGNHVETACGYRKPGKSRAMPPPEWQAATACMLERRERYLDIVEHRREEGRHRKGTRKAEKAFIDARPDLAPELLADELAKANL